MNNTLRITTKHNNLISVTVRVSDDNFPVSEIFESLQGEGNYAGVNSLFVRFQLCNLTCTWCDTKYTWTSCSDKFKLYARDELMNLIQGTTKNHIIFTGGEPALYRLDLIACGQRMYHVETNGTIVPVDPLKIELRDGTIIERKAMDEKVISRFNWVVSPKLSNSKQDIKPEALSFWAECPYAVFKFIVGSIYDLDEAGDIIQKYGINQARVYVGLLGTTPESQLRGDIVDELLKRGFHFSPRLQVLFWGQNRGK